MFAWLIPLVIFIAVFLLALAGQRRFGQARLRRQALAVAQVEAKALRVRQESRLEKLFFNWLPVLAAPQKAWVPQPWGSGVERKLRNISKWQGRSAAEWLATKELTAVFGLLFGLAIGDFFLTVLAAVGGFFLPDLWLNEQDTKRRRSLMRELPEWLDLLSACMQAGMGFEQAVAVILERGRPGALATELTDMMRNLRMGQSRRDALQIMARRVDEQDFTTFVTALVQAERLGVSLAETLKTQAAQLRQKRSQQVEKQALEAPIKLLFPLIAFIFPVVFLILFGPIIVRFMQGF
ncbi:MAG: type II secretion system F family protein [Candidatus Firestonebacteria bacterium]|nr:type II secretion system F family protein [Candidatus Firestonebacteria bacterium]